MGTLVAGAARAAGFTLIEIVLVVGLVGILALAAMAGAQPNPVARAEGEARRLATLLELAYVEAGLRGAPLAWTPRPGGYAFLGRDPSGAWVELGADTPFRARSLAAGVELRGTTAVLAARGLHRPAHIVVSGGGAAFEVRSGALGELSIHRIHAR